MARSIVTLQCLAVKKKRIRIANLSFRLMAFTVSLFLSAFLQAQAPFVTTWKTNNPGVSDSNQILIPGTGINYSISWEEVGNSGNMGSIVGNGNTTVTFPLPGIYSVSITPGGGSFDRIHFNNVGDREKILGIDQWGDIVWSSMEDAYGSCTYLDCKALDIPDLSGVTHMSRMFIECPNLKGNSKFGDWNTQNVQVMFGMFSGADKFNQDIGNWNTENVTDMSLMFYRANSFNKDIGNWQTQNVKNMELMFYSALSFNQDIGNWNTQNVTTMESMFNNASVFNQNIGNWNTQKVINMSQMFNDASAFNQDIGNWDTQNVTNMSWMFSYAYSFNQDIGNWDTQNVSDMSWMFLGSFGFNGEIGTWNTGKVSNMGSMFVDAFVFNQDIGNWNTENVTNMSGMFSGADNFNQDIGDWNTLNVKYMEGMFAGAPSFNQDIGSWNIQNVKYMAYMFEGAGSFNQDIGNWQLNPVLDLANMFDNSGMDCNHYSATLMGWHDNPATPDNRTLGAVGMEYGNDFIDLRNHLINTKGWTIEGDLLINENCLKSSSIILLNGSDAIRLWPNPATDYLHIDMQRETSLAVYDLLGRQLFYDQFPEGESQMPLQYFSPGMYIFHFEQGGRHLVVVE